MARPKGGPAYHRLSLEEEGRRLRIWATTKTDRTAAAKAGVTSAAWTTWRNRRGLPPRSDRSAAFLAAWRQATTDEVAAKILGVTSSTFMHWRWYHGLPPCLGNRSPRHAARRFDAIEGTRRSQRLHIPAAAVVDVGIPPTSAQQVSAKE